MITFRNFWSLVQIQHSPPSFNTGFYERKKMTRVEMKVKGKNRKVYLEKKVNPTVSSVSEQYNARTYVGSKVVSGSLMRYKSGITRFIPTGVNAKLV